MNSKTVNEMYAASLERMTKTLKEWPSPKKTSNQRMDACSVCGDWVSMTDAVSFPSGKTVCLACQDERRMDVNSGPFNALDDYERSLVGEARHSDNYASFECLDCGDYSKMHADDFHRSGWPCFVCGSKNTVGKIAGSDPTDQVVHHDEVYREALERDPLEGCDDCGMECDAADDLIEVEPGRFVCSTCHDYYKHLPMGGNIVCEGGPAGCSICGNSCYGADDLCYDCQCDQMYDDDLSGGCRVCGDGTENGLCLACKLDQSFDDVPLRSEAFDPGISYSPHRYDPQCTCPDCAEYEARIQATASGEEKELRRQKARRLGQEFRESANDYHEDQGGWEGWDTDRNDYDPINSDMQMCKCGCEDLRYNSDGSVMCKDCKRSWMPIDEADGDAGTQLVGAMKNTLKGKGDASVDPDDPSEALYQLVGSLVTGPAMLTNPATYDRISALKDTFDKAHPEKKGTVEKLGSLVKSLGSKFGADIRAAKGGELPPSVGRGIQQSFDSYKKMFGKLAKESRFVQPTLTEAMGIALNEAGGKLDPGMYSHINDRNDDGDDELQPGELSMQSLGGGKVGGHGDADVSGWEDIDEASMMSLDDTCEKCGSSDTERVTTDSEYSGGIERGVHCMECDATTWSDDSAMALTAEAKKRKVTCPACDGGGLSYQPNKLSNKKKCKRCKGSGEVMSFRGTPVDEAKKPSAKTQKKAAKSFVKGTKKFSDKVSKAKKAGMKNPEGFAAWSMHKALGKWPSEK